MNLAPAILGSTAVKRLATAGSEYVLVVGSDRLTRGDLAAVGCFNFAAARNLTHALTDFPVKNLKQLYLQIPPWQLAVPRVGVITLAVLGAAFEAKGIGGGSPLESYAKFHIDETHKAVVTFDTLKHRTAQERAAEKKAKRKRKAERRDQAHEIRVQRFDERQHGAGEGAVR